MKGKIKRKTPEIVFRNGKPSAVIMDIKDYREILERLEDTEDLKMLDDMRKKPLKFKKVDDFLNEVDRRV
ncbi:MAG: type II toxin-antitoxin system prevent-host-death family antitoxin [Deltaproteobacteria bacterium]|nr:type II toxin-antitoxin system prevent-host-death family antitoxin [Deltaproteobacteria bacterium]